MTSFKEIALIILKSGFLLTLIATFIGTMFGAFFGSLSTYVLAYDPGFYFSDYPLIMHTEKNHSNRDYDFVIQDECPVWMYYFKRYDYEIRLKHGDLPYGITDLKFFQKKNKDLKQSFPLVFNLEITTNESIKKGIYPVNITAVGGNGKRITIETDISVATSNISKNMGEI